MEEPVPVAIGKWQGEQLWSVLDAWRIATKLDDCPTYFGTATFISQDSREQWYVHGFTYDPELTPAEADEEGATVYVADPRRCPTQPEPPHVSDHWGNSISQD